MLLLKSSDRVAHDIELAQRLSRQADSASASSPPASSTAAAGAAGGAAAAHQVSLVLRKWYDLRPERELRCFVHQHDVHAISQRDASQHFPQLAGGWARRLLCAACTAAHGLSLLWPNLEDACATMRLLMAAPDP